MQTYLIQRLRQLHQLSNGFCVLQALLESFELLSSLDSLGLSDGDGDDVLSGGDGKDVELVVEDEAVVAGSERKDEPLVEPRNDGRVRVGSVSSVDILEGRAKRFGTRSQLEQQSKRVRVRLCLPWSWCRAAEASSWFEEGGRRFLLPQRSRPSLRAGSE